MAKLNPVDFTAVTLEGRFWPERLETVLAKTIPSQFEEMVKHKIIDSLDLPQPMPPLTIPCNSHNFTTQIFWDSDVGKWIEAASYALSHRRDKDIEDKIDMVVEKLALAQLDDGYLNCWYLGREPEKRWTNLRDNHELYCAGHMLEGAIAYFQTTGRRKFLDIMLRYVDHMILKFGRGNGQTRGYCGHQEIELALLKLYVVTREKKHLDLARYFIDERGAQPHYFDKEAIARGDDPKHYWAKTYEYNQSHRPVREQDEVVGHAVRAMYMYAAMADIAAETGDAALKSACEKLWHDVTEKRMYVTAGLGPSATNEGFTSPYDLPNETAYAETCASVALIFWAKRMLNLDCDSAYADILELSLFNGTLSGLSRDGVHYFYANPLESDGNHQRWTWHPCPCCTMNVSRLVASVGNYFYSQNSDTIAVHLYGSNTASIKLDGTNVTLKQTADYPWSGNISLEVNPEIKSEFTLKLRVPGWAKEPKFKINGKSFDHRAVMERGYAAIRRLWKMGDIVTLDFPMPVERIYAHPRVRQDVGRVALKRGPLVFCLEGADNPGVDLSMVKLVTDKPIKALLDESLFGGTVRLWAPGFVSDSAEWAGKLYKSDPKAAKKTTLTALPYYLWCNRGSNRMLVWVPEA